MPEIRSLMPEDLIQKKICKLADFGISRWYYNFILDLKSMNRYRFYDIDHLNFLDGYIGYENYLAPELKNNQKVGKPVDIYSIGIL
jgi:serine/threonine protein kinase